jgi:2-dehydropantoate 2-reductase
MPVVTIVGAGGIGACVAAELRLAGADVVLVDNNRRHVEQIRTNGLLVKGIRGEYRVDFPDVLLPDEWSGPAELVLLAVKSQHTSQAVLGVLPHLHGESTVVSLQNGWNASRIADVVGAERTVATMLHVVGSYDSPGEVTRHSEGTVYLGELDGSASARTDALAAQLAPAFRTESVRNIWGYIWSKQVYGATMPVNALVDLPASESYAHDWVQGVLLAVIAEGVEAAEAEGIRLEAYERFRPDEFALGARDYERVMTNLPKGSAKGNSGVWRDIKVHRRPTEVEYLSGELVRIGRRHGLAMRVNACVVDLVAQIESGRREMGWHNLHLLADPAYHYLSEHPTLAAFAPRLARDLDRQTS